VTVLTDLFGHQEWADAEHWRAIQACPDALSDARIKLRLHHIHVVQRALAWVVGSRDKGFEITTVEDFTDPELLKKYAQEYHVRIVPELLALTPEQLARRVAIPWFKDPPLELRVEEALLQCVMHSHYHRGQNATKLRERGGEPPMTDLIVWYWKGKPAADWTVR
jgi:uncharacterized damage-inducible protein DinB